MSPKRAGPRGEPRVEPRVKPRLRGVSHELMCYASLLGCAALLALAPPGRPTFAGGVFGLSLAAMFGFSALYHRPHWAPGRRIWLRRLDHAGIYLLIAGTYTPLCLLGLPPAAGERLLALVWGVAGLGVAQALLWPGLPKAATASLYVVMGWLVVSEWAAVQAGIGPGGVALLIGGGATYTVGAVIYALRRPDPWPAVFGYHEVFHALTIAAALQHGMLVLRLVWGPPGP